MNRRLHSLRAAFAAFLLLSSTLVTAGKVDILPGDNNVKGVLEAEAKFHLHALQNALQETKHATFVRDDGLMKELRTNTTKSTVARVEYKYKGNPGAGFSPGKRIYHAKSGRSIEGTLRRIEEDRQGGNGAGSSSSSSGNWSQDLLDDVAEQRFYPDLPVGEVRVTARSRTSSQLRSDPQRSRDAELKALRELENDINTTVVPAGGELEIFVSQPPCSSCTEALTKLADAYKLDKVVVHHLTNAPRNPSSPLSASQKASSEFFAARATETRTALATGKVRPGKTSVGEEALGVFERAEALEAGRLRVAEAACVQ